MPWRNGRGVTLEIARDRSSKAEFEWRLSLAMLAENGPFSAYPGYRRSVTLIAGEGFRLDAGGRDPAVLDTIGATHQFPGDAPPVCSLLGGDCRDLSLIVREPGEISSVSTLETSTRRSLPTRASAMNAIFCLAGAAELVGQAAGTGGEPEGAAIAEHVALHDTLLLCPCSLNWTAVASTSAPAVLLLLAWTPTSDA